MILSTCCSVAAAGAVAVAGLRVHSVVSLASVAGFSKIGLKLSLAIC